MELNLEESLLFPGLPKRINDVQREMVSMFSEAPDAIAEGCLRQITAGGKRLRPALVIAVSNLVGEHDSSTVTDGAVAVELVHTGSLIHDDIIDRAGLRRKVATINATDGNDMALLAGDFVLGIAGETGIRASQAIGMTMALTIKALCVGQATETVSVFQTDRSLESYELALQGKTAALLSACCSIGVLSTTPNDKHALDVFRAFGNAFGMAFQIVDDVLDIASTTEEQGKDTGKDILAGVLTLPLILARDAGDSVTMKLLENAWAPSRQYDNPKPQERLKKLMEKGVEVDEGQAAQVVESLKGSPYVAMASNEALRYARMAENALEGVNPRVGAEEQFEKLRKLPSAYVSQTTQGLTE